MPVAIAIAPADAPRPRERSRLGRLLRAGLPRFLLVGTIGLATDATLYAALAGLGAPDAVGRALSLATATIVTWQLNRRLTFVATGRGRGAEGLRYAGVALCAQGLNYGLFLLGRAIAPTLPPLAVLAGCAAAATAFSFTGQSLVTFGRRGRFAEPAASFGSGR